MNNTERCTCPSIATWRTRTRALNELSTGVHYQGVVLSLCGVSVRWSCEHYHERRDDAERCADKELDKSTGKR